MSHTRHIVLVVYLFLFVLAAPALGQSTGTGEPPVKVVSIPAAEPGDGKAVQEPPLPYTPPLRGAPGNRIGGGTRGGPEALPDLAALVPDHTSLSATVQPTLYWTLSAPTDKPMELAVNDENAGTALFSLAIPVGAKAGLHSFDCASKAIRLAAGVDYTWLVVLKVDPEEPSKNVLAGGHIVCIEPSAEIKARLSQAGSNAASVYAQAGYWYDALKASMDLVAANPGQAEPRRQLTGLLEQAGLSPAASAEIMKP